MADQTTKFDLPHIREKSFRYLDGWDVTEEEEEFSEVKEDLVALEKNYEKFL